MRKIVRLSICTMLSVAGIYLLANVLYFFKTEAGIKVTDQPHHGWLFPFADRALNKFPPGDTKVELHL